MRWGDRSRACISKETSWMPGWSPPCLLEGVVSSRHVAVQARSKNHPSQHHPTWRPWDCHLVGCAGGTVRVRQKRTAGGGPWVSASGGVSKFLLLVGRELARLELASIPSHGTGLKASFCLVLCGHSHVMGFCFDMIVCECFKCEACSAAPSETSKVTKSLHLNCGSNRFKRPGRVWWFSQASD